MSIVITLPVPWCFRIWVDAAVEYFLEVKMIAVIEKSERERSMSVIRTYMMLTSCLFSLLCTLDSE